MEELRLWLEDLLQMPYTIDEVKETTVLDLSLHEIHQSPPNLDLMVNLKELYLNHNHLSDLKLNLPNLESFDCQYNQIKTLELDCPKLTMLFMNNNEMKSIKLNTPNLKLINISSNNLKLESNSKEYKLFKKIHVPIDEYEVIESYKFSSII